MNELTNCGLLVNGRPLSWYGGAALLDYSVGETELKAETFQGVDRTSWNLLKAFAGRRKIRVAIVFTGDSLHAAKLQRSKLNAALFGRCELFISDDGFFYDCACESFGAEVLVGIGAREAKIKSDYVFHGIRRDALQTVTVPANGSFFCKSTFPFTDCRLTATVADSETLTGNPVTVKNSAGKTITSISSVITPSASGISAVTIQQSNGTETSSTSVPLGKTVYGGSVDATGGELTETHAGSVYDPVDIPAALDTLIVDATTLETATPGPVVTFDCELGEYPLSALSVAIEPVQSGTGTPSPDNIRPISGWSEAKVWVKSTHDTSSSPTLTIDLDGTRYGGTLDVLTGVMTLTHVSTTFNSATGWSYKSAATLPGVFSKTITPHYKKYGTTAPNSALMCDKLKTAFKSGGYNDVLVNGLTAYSGGDAVNYIFYLCPENRGFTTVSELGNWLSANPLQVVYELETPQTVQLTAQQVSSLLGANNVWADTGEISGLSYRDGNVSAAGILTQSGALVSGESVAYPLAAPAVSSITPITAPALLSGDVTISGSSGALSVTVGKQVPNPYPLGGAAFSDVSAGDVLVFDGINGVITKNGAPYAASVSWVNFPSLAPGENENDALDTVTVEYFPAYI